MQTLRYVAVELRLRCQTCVVLLCITILPTSDVRALYWLAIT